MSAAVAGPDVKDANPTPSRKRPVVNWRKGTRWFAAEFLVVVTGVLVALALNAWWEARQDQLRERAYLSQLRADLNDNRERLEESIRLEELTRNGAIAALNALNRPGPVPPDSALHFMITQRASFYSDPRLLMGTVSALVQTGDVKLLRNSRIRQSVIAYQSQIDADQVELSRWVERLLSYLTQFYATAAAADAWRDWDSQETPYQVRALLSAQERDGQLLRDALFGMYWTSGNRLTYLRRMLAATNEILAVLDAE